MTKTARWSPFSHLRMPRSKASGLLLDRIKEGKSIRNLEISTTVELDRAEDRRGIWREYNKHLLVTMFDTQDNSEEFERVMKVAETREYGSYHFPKEVSHFRKSMETGMMALASLIERLQLYPESTEAEVGDSVPTKATQKKLSGPKTAASRISKRSDQAAGRVFVIHGHDEEMKQSVARFLEQLGLEVTILHEKPDAGRTVIEKLEEHSEVSYVVVLLSPDDLGSKKDEADRMSARPRQNVVFELGFFVGRLGRSRVCAMVKENVEIMSDLRGVLYKTFDGNGAWRLGLAKELETAGIEIDKDGLIGKNP